MVTMGDDDESVALKAVHVCKNPIPPLDGVLTFVPCFPLPSFRSAPLCTSLHRTAPLLLLFPRHPCSARIPRLLLLLLFLPCICIHDYPLAATDPHLAHHSSASHSTHARPTHDPIPTAQHTLFVSPPLTPAPHSQGDGTTPSGIKEASRSPCSLGNIVHCTVFGVVCACVLHES